MRLSLMFEGFEFETENQLRLVFQDTLGIIYHISLFKHMLMVVIRFSSARRGDSNEYQQNML